MAEGWSDLTKMAKGGVTLPKWRREVTSVRWQRDGMTSAAWRKEGAWPSPAPRWPPASASGGIGLSGPTSASGTGSMAKRRRRDSGDECEPAPGPGLGRGRRRPEGRRLVVVLEGAALESVKVGKNFELLNCDKHKSLLLKHGRDPGTVRPDITHQSLLMLMDSPLNRSGQLQVFIHTQQNALIQINPQTRIPRTFDRFCGLMVQLLHKLSVRASDGPQKLLKMIRNPISDHLPVGCPKFGTSFHAGEVTDLSTIIPTDDSAVFVVGAFAHGSVDVGYTERTVSISHYPLSAALTCAKICTAFESAWGVV